MYRIALMPLRWRLAMRYYWNPLWQIVRWVFSSRETTNLTYELTDLNKKYLAAFVAEATGVSIGEAQKYLNEIESDETLKKHVIETGQKSKFRYKTDAVAHFGRRMGWYMFVRILKPRVVVETGVEKGMGSCVLAAALLRNAAEGAAGRYYGTDINPDAGFLFTGQYATVGKILYGDSIESLKKLDEEIDLFINDSDHSIDYEAREYDVVAPKMSANGYILSDNAHVGASLFDFALKTNRKYLYYQEQPKNHWYPGASIGAAFR